MVYLTDKSAEGKLRAKPPFIKTCVHYGKGECSRKRACQRYGHSGALLDMLGVI